METCKYKYCRHTSREIEEDDLVIDGKNTYHSDCLSEKKCIEKIIDVFSKEVNENVVFSQLRNVINNIVIKKGIDAPVLLFGIQYYLKNNIPLNYPQGLYYVVQNKRMWEAYYKRTEKKNFVEIPEEHESVKFTHKPPEKNIFEKMIKGD